MDEETKQMITDERESDEIRDFIRSMGEDKGIDKFFIEVVNNDDNLKIGNVTQEELGMPQLPLRTMVELGNDCEDIPSMSSFARDFKRQSLGLIATSLSKEGFLIKARITQKKELMNTDKRKTRTKRGLFGKKEEEE